MTIKYIIHGYRWFDKTYGNTYHTVYIYDNENYLVWNTSDMVYGYDDQYRHTAYDYLISKRLMSEDDRFNHDWIRANFHFSVHDVSRKKDLF